MKRNTYKLATLSVAVILASAGFTKEWKKESSPAIFDPAFNTSYDSLPRKAKLEGVKEPWNDSIWPNYKGGIAAAPFSESPAFNPEKLTREELRAMIWGKNRGEKAGRAITETEMKNLSPAEKFDIYRKRYDYPLTNAVLSSTSPNQPKWIGLAHGWAAAAINHAEPAPITVTSSDGILLPFGSSDVKALMSYYYGTYAYQKRQMKRLGKPCKMSLANLGKCTKDLNAGALHVVLANLVGIKEKSFVIDTSRFGEIYNQPVIGYHSKELEQRTLPTKGITEILLHTTIYLAGEIPANRDAVIGTSNQKIQTLDYTYWLELDPSGHIIGGHFKEGEVAPDFLWTVSPMKFEGDFSELNEIYTPAALNYVQD